MLKFVDQEFKRLIGFKYLGSTLTKGNDITIEIRQRIIMGNRVVMAQETIKFAIFVKQTKCTVYTKPVGRVPTHGSDN